MIDKTKRGEIHVIGLGPGARSLMTPAAVQAVERCDTVVGYAGYVRQIADLVEGKDVVAMDLGEEIDRAAKAADLAYVGRRVALVSSGDAGVYGMAGPLFEVLCQRGWDGQTPAVEVAPGVTAMQAAAARLGAPLMHDFCAISLSDLLCPWEKIRKRLTAAAEADFVTALYNPRSARRTKGLEEARAIFLLHRDPSTPVGVVRNAYREGERVLVTSLGDLGGELEVIDMFSMVIIGSSATFARAGRIITSRGYLQR